MILLANICSIVLQQTEYSSFAKRVEGSIICFDIYYFIDIIHMYMTGALQTSRLYTRKVKRR
jgi:hypothetical protein